MVRVRTNGRAAPILQQHVGACCKRHEGVAVALQVQHGQKLVAPMHTEPDQVASDFSPISGPVRSCRDGIRQFGIVRK
jgi:hypothetical protein